MSPRLLLSSGEPSGDQYAAELLRHLKVRSPDLEAFGLGGDRLAEQSAHLVAHVRDLAVVGLVEVVRHLPRIRRIFRDLLAEVDRRRPDLAVLVDYPDFNLRLARALHARAVPVVYYVTPQVWAWRRGRLAAIREAVRRVIVIFPFEEQVYAQAGVPVTFVGHPLVDLVRPASDPAAFLREHGLDPGRPLIAVLPGSRRQELAHNLPPLIEAIGALSRRRPELQFALALAPGLVGDPQVASLGSRLTLIPGRTHAVVGAATAAIVASGTATVETALLGTPMVVVYRISPLTYALGQRFVRVPHYAMVNLIAGRRVVPELMQRDFTAQRVTEEVMALLEDAPRRERMRVDLEEVRLRLGAPGASARAADVVATELEDIGLQKA